MTQEALKLALEELANRFSEGWHEGIKIDASDIMLLSEAAEALSQRTEQEPVALPCCGYADASAVKWNPFNNVVQCHNCGQVYTTPPQRSESSGKPSAWVGLTKKEVHDLYDADYVVFHQRIEAKLKEKNT
jgi:hypothetical protein